MEEAERLAMDASVQAEARRQDEREREAAFWVALEDKRRLNLWQGLRMVLEKVVGGLRWAMEFMLAQAGEMAKVDGEASATGDE